MNRRRVIILCGLIVSLAAAAAILPAQTPAGPPAETPKSQALLVVVPDSGRNPLAPQGPRPTPEEIERAKAAMLALAKTEVVLVMVIDDPHVKNTKWYRDNVADAVPALRRLLTAASVPGTDLISFSMTGADRHELPEIINAWAEAFVKDVTDFANGDRIRQIATITTLQNRLKQERSDVEHELMTLPDSDERVLLQKITLRMQGAQSLSSDLVKAQLAVAKAERRKKMIEELGNPERWWDGNDPVWNNLTHELVKLAGAREAAGMESGAQSRPAQDLEVRTAETKREMLARMESLRKAARDKVEAALELTDAQALALADQASLEESQRSVKVLGDALKTATELGAKKRSLESSIDLLEKRLLEMRLLVTGERTVYIRRVAGVAF
jgi:hypothetical protein